VGGATVLGASAVLADKYFTGGEYLSTVKDFGSETINSMSNMVGGKKKKRRSKRKRTKRKRTKRKSNRKKTRKYHRKY